MDLGRAVKATLDVCVHGLLLVTCRAKVDELDGWRLQCSKKNVLRLEITMYEPCFFEYHERIKQLHDKNAHQACAKSAKRVLLDELIQIR